MAVVPITDYQPRRNRVRYLPHSPPTANWNYLRRAAAQVLRFHILIMARVRFEVFYEVFPACRCPAVRCFNSFR